VPAALLAMNTPTESAPVAPRRFAWLVLLCLFAAFAAGVAHFSRLLPDRVATHFGGSGHPNGWMTRVQYVKFTLGIGIGTPVFILAVFAIVERLKGLGLNIPNKAYWLEPARQDATYAFLRRQGYWLAGLIVIFHALMFGETVMVNSRSPIVLPTGQFLACVGGFLVALAVWAGNMFARFRLPKI
jgi:serine/threonine-protein kinase